MKADDEINLIEREIAAYLFDRAALFDVRSPCWVALVSAGEAVARGEAHGEAIRGNLDELYKWVDKVRDWEDT